MIEETGQVVAVDGDLAYVRAASRAGCQRCAEGRGCGGGVIGLLLADRLATVAANGRDIELAPGDRVRLAVRGSVLVRVAAFVYLLPLALMLAVMVLTGWLLPATGLTGLVVAAAAGLAAGILLARRQAARRRSTDWQPVITGRLQGDQACD